MSEQSDEPKELTIKFTVSTEMDADYIAEQLAAWLRMFIAAHNRNTGQKAEVVRVKDKEWRDF